MRLACLAICSLAATACTPEYDPCFEPPSLITEMRVIAVRADPPEALVDLSANLVPTVQVRALIVGVQDPAASLQIIGQVCAPTVDLSCPAGTPSIAGPVTVKGAAEATLALDVPASVILAARAADPLGGYGGTRVQLVLQALANTAAGVITTSATKTLLYSDSATTPEPNQPIELQQVDVTLDGGLVAVATSANLISLDVGDGYGLRPRLAPLPDGGTAAETYQTVDLSGQEVTLVEQISYEFYAGPDLLFGDLPIDNGTPIGVYIQGAGFADEPQPGAPDPVNGLVRVTPMLSSEPHAWVVGRDSRGAVAWTTVSSRVFDPRMCDGPNGGACPIGQDCCLDPFVGCK